jgi:phage terminase small subunit
MPKRSKLTLKQDAFVRAYLETANASEAYRRAYHVRKMGRHALDVEAGRLLRHPAIALRLEAEQAKIAQRHNLTVDRIIGELALIGFCNMLDYIATQTDGSVIVDLSALTRDQAAAIQNITVDTFMEGKDGKAREVRRVKFKLRDKRAALVDLGRHLGMFRDTLENSQKLDASAAFVEMLKSISPKHNPKLVEGATE